MRTRERIWQAWRTMIWIVVTAVVRAGARLSGYPEDVYLTYYHDRKLRDETGRIRFSVLDADPRTRPYDVTGKRPWGLTQDGLAARRVARIQRSILLEERRKKRQEPWKPTPPSTPWERVFHELCETWMKIAESRARGREVMERLERLERTLATKEKDTWQ
jgi:hypothetical protein